MAMSKFYTDSIRISQGAGVAFPSRSASVDS